MVRQDKDSVIVTQAPAEGARLPFWKGETKGRDLRTSLAFGRILGELEKACREGELEKALEKLGIRRVCVGPCVWIYNTSDSGHRRTA